MQESEIKESLISAARDIGAGCVFFLPRRAPEEPVVDALIHCLESDCEVCHSVDFVYSGYCRDSRWPMPDSEDPAEELKRCLKERFSEARIEVANLRYQGEMFGTLGFFWKKNNRFEEDVWSSFMERLRYELAAWYYAASKKALGLQLSDHEKHASKKKGAGLLFQSLFRRATFGVVLCDLKGYVVDANQHFGNMLETPVEELRGVHFTSFTHPSDLDENRSYFQMLVEDQTKYYKIYKRYLSSSGKILPARVSVSLIELEEYDSVYALGIIEDIQQEEEFRHSLEKQESKYYTLFHNSQDAIFVHPVYDDGSSGNFIEVNDTACKRYDYTREELFQMSPRNMETEEEAKGLSQRIQEFMDLGFMLAETKHRDRSGNVFPVEINAHLFRMDDARMSMTIVRDISRRKENEKKTREQERQLMEQARMVTMGEMVGAIAHQWKQPLNILGIYIQDMYEEFMDRGLDQPYMDDLLKKFMSQIQYMSKTIDDFRDFIKPSGSAPIPVDAVGVAKATAAMIDLQLHRASIQVQFEFLPQDSKIFILGYSSELKQVIINLLGNAREAIEKKRRDQNLDPPFQDTIHVLIQKTGDTVEIQVKDTGTGIPEEVMDQIFDPYFTTRGENGTGIGLYLSRRIVEQRLNGSLEAENRTDGTRGAQFTLRLKAS